MGSGADAQERSLERSLVRIGGDGDGTCGQKELHWGPEEQLTVYHGVGGGVEKGSFSKDLIYAQGDLQGPGGLALVQVISPKQSSSINTVGSSREEITCPPRSGRQWGGELQGVTFCFFS